MFRNKTNNNFNKKLICKGLEGGELDGGDTIIIEKFEFIKNSQK